METIGFSDVSYYSGYFEWLKEFVPEEIHDLLYKEFPWRLSDGCRQILVETLTRELLRIAWPTLSNDMVTQLSQENILWKLLPDSIPEEKKISARDKQLAYLKEKGIKAYADSAPLLKEKLQLYGKDYLKAIFRMLEVINENASDISQHFFTNKAPGPLTGLTRFSSYLGAVCVTVLKFGENKLVFKPRDSRIDKWFEDISKKYFSDCLYVPDTLTIEDECGFFEYVHDAPADHEPEALDAIRNLGAYTAIAVAFGSRDLHFGNFQLRGSLVVPLDLECVLYPAHYTTIEEEEVGVQNTIAMAALMPINHDSPSSLIETNEEYSILPKINGRRVSVLDYPEQFRGGFRDMYNRCKGIREELSRELDRTKGFDLCVLVFNGYMFGLAIQVLNHPERLDSWSSQDYFIEVIKKARPSEAESLANITKEASECVKHCYYPLFQTKTDSLNVYHEGRLIQANWLKTSAISHTKENFNKMGDSDIKLELDLIFTLLEERFVNCPEDPDSLPEGEKKQLLQKIKDNVLYYPDGRPTWIPEFDPNDTSCWKRILDNRDRILKFLESEKKIHGQ